MKDGQTETTLRSAYLAGPMRGIEDYNFPAFKAAASWLRSDGWSIYSPAERDEEDPNIIDNQDLRNQMGEDWDWSGTHGLDYFMSFDLRAVCSADAVICLPGWEQSQGARLETMVAIEVGHPVFEITGPNGTALGRKRNGSLKFGDAQLSAISPEYVKAAFVTETLGMFAVEACGCDPEVVQVDPVNNPEYVMGPGDEVPRLATPEEIASLRAAWGRQDPKASSGVLPADSAGRKSVPITTGVLDYFPAALIEVAKVSKAGNDKHNPGQPLHHARGKSTDHADSLLRHLIDRGKVDEDTGCLHSAEVAWRALALLQQELEDAGAPLARGARLA